MRSQKAPKLTEGTKTDLGEDRELQGRTRELGDGGVGGGEAGVVGGSGTW